MEHSTHTVTLQLNDLLTHLPPRPKEMHKRQCGHVLIIGGDHGFSGAVALAATAAYRVGAGLVSVATRLETAQGLFIFCPEIMAHAIYFAKELRSLISKSTAIVVGPGLGQSKWASALLNLVLKTEVPLVVDADALHLLAKHPSKNTSWILTPHPGEAAHLLQCTVEQVQQNRLETIVALQKRYGGTVILKGAGSLVLSSSGVSSLCTAGNPGMASGGMGDVLSGVIGGLLAQGLTLDIAATLGVCLHATAGDLAAKAGERGTLASDLLPHLRTLVNACAI